MLKSYYLAKQIKLLDLVDFRLIHYKEINMS